MYRSSSWNRVTDDYSDPPSKAAPPSLRPSNSFDSNVNELPGYDPIVELARKEKARVKFAENAVHIIPFVLFLCAIVLWFFSNPDVNLGIKGDPVAAKGLRLTLDGEIDNDSDGTQTGFLPLMDSEPEEDSPNRLHKHKHSKKLTKGLK